MSDRRRLASAAVAAGLLLSGAGCLVGPDFHRPEAPAAAGYLPSGETGPGAAEDPQPQRVALGQSIPAMWWGVFHSTRLDEILRQAIQDSYTLAAARATLVEAQEEVVAARGGLYPQVDFGAGARRSRSLSGGSAGTVANLFSFGPKLMGPLANSNLFAVFMFVLLGGSLFYFARKKLD